MDKHRFTLLIIGVFGVAILLGGWFLGVQPQLNRIGQADAQLQSARELNESQAIINAGLAADNQKLDEYKAQLAAAQALIPATRSQQALIDQIEASAAASGVTIKSINFDLPVEFSPTVGVPVDLPASGTLIAVPIEIVVGGERGAAEVFAAGLQAQPRIVTVSGSGYSGPDDPTLTLSGVTWVLKPVA